MTAAPIFDSFLTDSDLGSRLASMTTHGRLKSACVGLQIDGRRLFAAAREGIQIDPGAAENHLVPATCLAKPLTATLLAAAACSHHLNWSDEISAVLGLSGPWKDKLTGISLASLLNHTHGLDAPTVPRLPRTHDGFVDVEALCGQLAVTPLSAPGLLHSYSSTGAWFAGALLERLSGRPYSKLLGEQQLWHASRASNPVYAGYVCPASGAELSRPTVSEWLSFVAFHLADSPAGTDGVLAQTVASLRAGPGCTARREPFRARGVFGLETLRHELVRPQFQPARLIGVVALFQPGTEHRHSDRGIRRHRLHRARGTVRDGIAGIHPSEATTPVELRAARGLAVGAIHRHFTPSPNPASA